MYNEELSYAVQGNTYIQNGLMEAFQKLIPDSNGNSEGRIPVITLMSDGARQRQVCIMRSEEILR